MSFNDTQIYTLQQVAVILQVSERAVRRVVVADELKARRMGRSYRVLGAEIRRFMRGMCLMGKAEG